MHAAYWVFAMRWLFATVAGNHNQQVIILSLGQEGPADSIAAACCRRGWIVHLFSTQPTPAERMHCHRVYRWPLLEHAMHNGLLQKARRIKPLAILIANKDILIPLHYFLATSLGLQHVNKQAVDSSLDKLRQKAMLAEAKLPQGKWRILYDRPEKLELHDFPYPAVIKPSIGTASKGITRIANCSEISAGLKYIQSWQNDVSVGNEFFIEEYIEGRQFDVEGLAFAGQFYPLCIIEESYSGHASHFPPRFFLFNPPLDRALCQLIEGTAIRAIGALGVTTGAWHCEIRVAPGNNPYVLDYANRMGYDRLVSLASGTDFANGYIDTMLGKAPMIKQKKRKSILYYYLTSAAEVETWQLLVRLYPDIVRNSVFHSFDFSVSKYYGKVFLLADTYREIIVALQECGIEISTLPKPLEDNGRFD